MNVEQIKTILQGTEATLKLVLASSEYQQIQRSQWFTTSNDFMLDDAVQVIAEVLDGISIAEHYEIQLHHGSAKT